MTQAWWQWHCHAFVPDTRVSDEMQLLAVQSRCGALSAGMPPVAADVKLHCSGDLLNVDSNDSWRHQQLAKTMAEG